ncbi:MAG: MoaD/ThiS family protein, partial [Gammaproteobacteria bacterium]
DCNGAEPDYRVARIFRVSDSSPGVTVDVVVMGHLLDDLFEPERFSGKNLPIDDKRTVVELAMSIGLENKDEYFVVLNDEHLPIDVWHSHELSAGDRIIFCPLLKGG